MPMNDLLPQPTRPLAREEILAIALGRTPDRLDFAPLYLGLRGRINRRTFWLHGVLVLLVVGVLLNVFLDIAGISADDNDRFVNIALAWPLVAISAKRLHDFNFSGWWMLINLVPGIGWFVTLMVNGIVPGTHGPNRFGPEPRPPGLSSAH